MRIQVYMYAHCILSQECKMMQLNESVHICGCAHDALVLDNAHQNSTCSQREQPDIGKVWQ